MGDETGGGRGGDAGMGMGMGMGMGGGGMPTLAEVMGGMLGAKRSAAAEASGGDAADDSRDAGDVEDAMVLAGDVEDEGVAAEGKNAAEEAAKAAEGDEKASGEGDAEAAEGDEKAGDGDATGGEGSGDASDSPAYALEALDADALRALTLPELMHQMQLLQMRHMYLMQMAMETPELQAVLPPHVEAGQLRMRAFQTRARWSCSESKPAAAAEWARG